MDDTFISFSSHLSALVKKIQRNNSTVPLALRISVSLSCLSLDTASLAMKRVAWCILKDPTLTKIETIAETAHPLHSWRISHQGRSEQ